MAILHHLGPKIKSAALKVCQRSTRGYGNTEEDRMFYYGGQKEPDALLLAVCGVRGPLGSRWSGGSHTATGNTPK